MTSRQRRLVLVLVLLVTMMEYGQRQLLALALVPIGVDLGVSDAALGGLLTAFGLCYAAAAPVLGRLADRTSRGSVLAAGAACFSVMTALGAAAGSIGLLALTRIGVGLGQAAVAPSGVALLADTYPPERRGMVLGLLTMAAPVGITVALVVGGFAIEAWGWRATFVGGGLLGVVAALLFAGLVTEPPRGFSEGREAEAGQTPGFTQVWAHMGRFRSFRHLLAATALASLGAITTAQWVPGFLHRVHGLSLRDAGIAFAIGSLASTLGALLSGVVADRAGTRDPRWYAWLPGVACLVAAPLHVAAFLWPSALGATLWLVPALFFAMFFTPPALAAVQMLAPVAMRASAGAMVTSTLVLVGMGLGPLLTGAVSDALRESQGEDSIRLALCGVAGVYAWSAVHFALAGRSLRDDVSAASSAPWRSA